jgi:hypothetical protein
MEDMILAGLLRALSYEIVEIGYLRPEEAASPAIADLGGSEVFLVDEIRKIAGFVHLVAFPCLLGAPRWRLGGRPRNVGDIIWTGY